MEKITRRKFMYASSVFMGIPFAKNLIEPDNKNPLLSFSTLGCPDWDFKQIVTFASKNGYNGIEVRGIQREMDLTKSKVFKNAEDRRNAVSMMKDKKLKFVCLGSSANLHLPEGNEREKNMDEARRFIDLADEIECPYVRVFPNKLPPDEEREKTIDRIANGLTELGNYASTRSVVVLMETHGDLVWSNDLKKVMNQVNNPQTGLVWDIANMWSVTKESPGMVYQKLKNYIHHIHIKNGKLINGTLQYTLTGDGDVPLDKAIGALQKGGYKGFYSFEWEKLWHPEILSPEIAIADYPKSVKKFFKL